MSIILCSTTAELPGDHWVADCAVSGGTLSEGLRALLRAAEGRLCVRIAPVYWDFPLPCPDGAGERLTAPQLQALRENAPCHVSEALCVEYFTCLRQNQAHVVLYDTEETLKRKLKIADQCGVPYALVEDDTLMHKLRECI